MPPKAVGRGAARGASERDTTATPNPENGSAPVPPTRPPVQRLQSLNRRTPGGSIAARGRPLPRDEPGASSTKTGLKFAPRSANRRAKEERDAILKLEEERNRQRISEAEAIRRARLGNAPRARGRGGRDGGMMFGGPGGFKRGRGGRNFDESRSSTGPRHTLSRSATPAQRQSSNNGGYSSSDEDEITSGRQINIDQINWVKDAELDADAPGKKPSRKMDLPYRGPRPIRVDHHEHEERVVSVDVDASTSTAAKAKDQVQEDEISDNELFIREDSGAVKVKSEPIDNDVDIRDLPQSEELGESPLPMQQVKARKSVNIKDPRSLLRTREEIDEFDRHNEDLETLKDILTPEEPVSTGKQPTTIGEETGEDVKDISVKEEDVPVDKNAGRLYLIQFPPLTPNLTIPGSAEVLSTEDDSAMEGGENTAPAEGSTGQGLGEAEIKREEDQDDETKPQPTKRPPGKIVTATQRQLPAGRVGRLHLHKSGRVTLDWGGISFELDKGADVNFVQEAVIASTSTTVGEEEQAEERAVWSMGQLSEKLIASPEWNKLL